MDYIAIATEMRRKAWEAIVASPDFLAFRAADNMVVELGGQSIMPDLSTTSALPPKINPRTRVRPPVDSRPRMSQPDVAYAVLRDIGPMRTVSLMEVCRERGANIGGANPINNFRSALSKDERFYSFRHDGEYLWWLTDVPLPEDWGEAADDLLAAASPNSNQEGGDGHAANNTNLAS